MKKLIPLLNAVIYMLVGAAAGFIAIRCEEAAGADVRFAPSMVCTIALVIAGMLLHTVIHEAGHMVGGLLSGYKFVSFRVGSFVLSKDGEKFKLGRMSLAGTAGQCLMAPPRLVDGKMPVLLYNFGGILMNFIVSGIFAALCLVFEEGSIAWAVFAILAIVGVAMAVINAIPVKGGINDGSNIMCLRKDPAVVRAFWLQLAVNAYVSMGTRMKDMPAVWFEKKENEDMSVSLIQGVAVMRLSRLMDEMRLAEAKTEADRLLKSGCLNPLYTNLVKCEALYLELVSGADSARVDELYTDELKKFIVSMKKYPGTIRTEYAYALLYEKNPQDAARKKTDFEKAAAKYPNQCEMEGERELIKYAESIAAEQLIDLSF